MNALDIAIAAAHLAGTVLVPSVAVITALTQTKKDATQQNKHREAPRKVAGSWLNSLPMTLLGISHAVDIGTTIGSSEVLSGAGGPMQMMSGGVQIIVWAFVYHQSRRDAPRILVLATAGTSLLDEIPLFVMTAINGTSSLSGIADIACSGSRLLALITLVANNIRNPTQLIDDGSDETRPILPVASSERTTVYGSGTISADSTTLDANLMLDETDDEYGDDDDDDEDDDEDEDDAASIKREREKRLKEKGGWLGYISDFRVFLPFLIPRHDRKVQLSLLVSILCILATRAFNVLIPRQLGIVADQLVARENPMAALAVWFVLDVLSHNVLIEMVQSLAKIPIKQFSYRQLTNAAFNHVLSLSMDFHSERDSAEVMKAVEQGEALANVLDTLVIEILPTAADLVIAFCYLYIQFSPKVAIAMLAAAVVFVTYEVHATSLNLDNKRESSKAKRDEARVMHQAVQGWQTVTYFNMLGFERRRFGRAVDAQLKASANYEIKDAYIQGFLDLMVPCTCFTLASLVIHDIINGKASPGSFVFFLQYWEYLIWPLKYLSHNYRYLMSDLVEAERLLYLLQTKASIADADDAVTLDPATIKGGVTFSNMSFTYDSGSKEAIHDFSLIAEPGQTIALVGETGAGKSSIIKLLLRLYDVSSGSIAIDGHDVRSMTLSSLRDIVGVVPQDPLLFNASVLENLRYARPGATDEEIYAACRAACVHDKILGFERGYDTKVGEQGVKLSGGEVQRLAIARVFLKDPPVLVLDEATSAVDTVTEAGIKEALDGLMKGGSSSNSVSEGPEARRQRTTFVIAHRLSTIVRADQILVMHDGAVVERGTHKELLEMGGRYCQLWDKQVATI